MLQGWSVTLFIHWCTKRRYSNNECFVDLVEQVDCIIASNGNVVFSEIRGNINCRSKLSGMPDLTLAFVNPRVLDDVSFHPCVRIQDWYVFKT